MDGSARQAVADEQAHTGHAIYSKSLLRVYDLCALRFSGRFIWRCPMTAVVTLYSRHVTANHLDVGVGTGVFLDRCVWPTTQPRIALMDVNPNCLDAATRRLARYQPEVYRANVLEPLPFQLARFESISVSWLLHCLPGDIHSKASVFDHLLAVLNPGGVIFGATLLNEGVRHTAISRRLSTLYNAQGIFTNLHDDVEGLKQVLAARFSSFSVDIIGCGALFSGRT
jgi:ubiquinone/menaquinone biosynthesis C-methylase UbiE